MTLHWSQQTLNSGQCPAGFGEKQWSEEESKVTNSCSRVVAGKSVK